MTEEEAQDWLTAHFDVSPNGDCVPRGTSSLKGEAWEQLETFIAFLKHEAAQQNLISAATVDHIWDRHIVDSAQLLRFASKGVNWLDLGSGAGFPGLIVGILSNHKVTLVESRGRRIDYLQRAIAMLDLEDRVKVAGLAVERLETAPYSVISARAFAPLPRLLELAHRFSTPDTLWLLPKGRNAVKELEEAQDNWNLDFTVESSVTDPDAGILVGRLLGTKGRVKAKGRRKT